MYDAEVDLKLLIIVPVNYIWTMLYLITKELR